MHMHVNCSPSEGDEQVEEAEKSREPKRKRPKLDTGTPVATKGIHVQLL